MSQTGPKKCFIPQNCEKYTNLIEQSSNPGAGRLKNPKMAPAVIFIS